MGLYQCFDVWIYKSFELFRLQDLDGMIICILASSNIISNNEIDAFFRSFRQTTEYTKKILLSTICEPSLEPNLILTTVLVIG